MPYNPLKPKFDKIVSRCRAMGNPIPGLFCIANSKMAKVEAVGYGIPAMAALLAIKPKEPGGWLALHTLEDIERNGADMGLPGNKLVMNRALETQSPFDEKLETSIEPVAWSVAGLLQLRGYDDLLRHYLEGVARLMPGGVLPGLKDPLTMPVSEGLIAHRGMQEPLGQWLPAFSQVPDGRSAARTYDLFDHAVVRMDSMAFQRCCEVFQSLVGETATAKAGYLARQAAHAHDSSKVDVARLIKATRDKEHVCVERTFTGIEHASSHMVGRAIMNGASLTQSAWSGPDSKGRAFESDVCKCQALAYAVIGAAAGADDALAAATLRRMHNEGHDVTIAHRDHANDAERARYTVLPLHLCAQKGLINSLVAVLEAGADSGAEVHGIGGGTLQNFADKNPTTSEAIMGAVRAFEARTKARALMEEMENDAPRPSA